MKGSITPVNIILAFQYTKKRIYQTFSLPEIYSQLIAII